MHRIVRAAAPEAHSVRLVRVVVWLFQAACVAAIVYELGRASEANADMLLRLFGVSIAWLLGTAALVALAIYLRRVTAGFVIGLTPRD